MKKLRFN